MRNAIKLFSSRCNSFSLSNLRFKSSKTKPSKQPKQSPNSTSLYENISALISPLHGDSITEPRNPESAQTVCRNASERRTVGNGSDLRQSQVGILESEDVGTIVERIAEIVLADKPGFLMEDRLDELDLRFNDEIVEMVIRKCVKVGHLALRFFNWVKSKPWFNHSTKIYNEMLYISSEAKNFDLVEDLVKEMEFNSRQKDINTWNILISHYGKAGRVGNALNAFESVKKSGFEPDYSIYKVIIESLCNANKPELVMEFHKEMVSKNLILEIGLCQMVLNCLAGFGDKELIRDFKDDLLNIMNLSESEVYLCILKGFCVKMKLKDAQEVFDEMRKKNIASIEMYETILRGLCKGGNTEEALEIINHASKTSLISNKAYNHVINGLLRKKNLEKALEIMNIMKESKINPTVSTYTQIMQHLFKSNRYNDAFKLFDEMLESDIQIDIVAKMALIAGFVHTGQISKAWSYFNGMREKNIVPNLKAYSEFIKELCEASYPKEAFRVIKEMISVGINPSKNIFQLVISCLSKNGELDLLEEVKNMKIRVDPSSVLLSNNNSTELNEISVSLPSEINTIDSKNEFRDEDVEKIYKTCKIFCSNQEWHAIQKDLESKNVHFTPQMVECILKNCARHGRVSLQFFAWVSKLSNYKHDTNTYNMAIKLAGGAKDFKHMRYLFHEMRRNECDIIPNTWTIMICQYGQAGLTEMALRAFKEMKMNGFKPDFSTYKFLILFLSAKKGRKVDESVQLFKEMVRNDFLPDKETVGNYLIMLCEANMINEARKCVINLCKKGFEKQLGYSMLVKAMCRACKIDEALELVSELEKTGCTVDRYIYGSIIHALLRGGRVNDALNKLEEMKSVGLPNTPHIYTSFMVHFFKEKNLGRAIEMFNDMREEGFEPTIVTYSSLIRGFMNNDMIKEAWDAFYRMKLKGPVPDFETYSMFMSCLCKVGRSEEALVIINDMLDSGIIPSSINLRTVFFGLNKEGKYDLARSVLQTKWKLNRERKAFD